MSKLAATFATEEQALAALEEIESQQWGSGQVLGPTEDTQRLISQQLFLSRGEAQKTAVGGLLGALLGITLLYLHHAGFLPLAFFAPLFAGGRYPAYLAVGGSFALITATLASIYCLTTPHRTLPTEPRLLIVFTSRPQLPRVRQAISRNGGQVV